MNKRYHISFLTTVFALFIVSCNGPHQRSYIDTPSSGVIHISVDESFKPVIDSEIQVFESQHPQTKIVAEYKSESDCLKDLKKDSTRMIIITRGLNDAEEKYYQDSLKFLPSWDKVANDAIAVIINNKVTDSTFSLSKIRGIIDGSTADKLIAVLDGVNQTSSLRFVMDSILKGKPFDKSKVLGVKNSRAVIDYVASNPNAIGFIGVSWIGNEEDTAQQSFLKKVRIAALECRCAEKTYVKPFQYNIMTKRYPLVRGLYYVLKENYNGLGSGFANFLEDEKGQLIFKRSYLGPAKINFSVRTAVMNNNSK